jgi:PleD family two-component response regulator
VWLPCETTGRPAVSTHGEAAFGRGQTILLLSGGREQLLHDEELLAALGYEPVGFLNGTDAVAACGATPERFDAILIACSLCPAHMRRLPALLHTAAPTLPILVASDPAEAFDLDALVSAGVSEVVTRPMIADEVAVALSRCLQTARRAATATLAPDGGGVANARASGSFSRPVEKRDERVPARLGPRSLEEVQTSSRRRSR